MTNSRNKGAQFERDIALELELLTGVRFKRNLEQSRAVDHCDLITDDPAWPFSCELKRYASGTGCKPAWWEQAKRAAAKNGKLPIVIYKYDRREIRACLPIHLIGNGSLPPDQEDTWFETSLKGLAYLAGEIMAANAAEVQGVAV